MTTEKSEPTRLEGLRESDGYYKGRVFELFIFVF